jgi:hypothetical protein
MKFQVPYKVHDPTCKTKARVLTRGNPHWPSDHEPGPDWVQFEAATYAEAERKIHGLILPDDPRKVLGTHLVKWWCG